MTKSPFLLCLFILALLAGCVPAAAPAPTAEPTAPVSGCTDGGPGVFTPEDVRCYLATFDPQFVWELDTETAVLFSRPDSLADWVGGAIIYHVPSVSSLVLDTQGDVEPQRSRVNNRAALVAFSRLVADPALLAELKQAVQQQWQTGDAGEPEIRLGLAWQDGRHSVFMVAVAGLPAADERFYCVEEAWTIGDEEIRTIPDCLVREEGQLVRHLFFVSKAVRGSQPVQLALDGVASNRLPVTEGEVSLETAVYQTAIRYRTGRAVVLRGETSPQDRLATAKAALTGAVDPALLQNFLVANQSSQSLEFLFWDHPTIFLQPGSVVEAYYLPDTGPVPDCTRFRSEYAGLAGGVIDLSQIGFSDDGRQAVLFLQQVCGPTAVSSSYLLLERQGEVWQVVDEFGLEEQEAAAPLRPEMVFNGPARGCGDMFLYQANSEEALSEFITLYLDVRAFPLSEQPYTLELADYSPAPDLRLELFGQRVYELGEFPYCNDVAPVAAPQSVWLARSGRLTVAIRGEIPAEACSGEGYQATVRLENIVFTSGTETVVLNDLLLEDVSVGWCAG